MSIFFFCLMNNCTVNNLFRELESLNGLFPFLSEYRHARVEQLYESY